MTPAELTLMRQMLREEIEPIREDVGAIKAKVGTLETNAREAKREIALLKDTDRKHSGIHREVKADLLPRMQSQTEEQIAAARSDSERGLGAAASAYERMLHLHDDLAARMQRMEEAAAERATKASMLIPDGKGGTSIVPAAIVAAESAHRNENKTAAIEVDTTATAKTARSIVKWQKVVATVVVVIPIVIETIRQVLSSLGH